MKSSKFYTFTLPNGKSYKIPALAFKAGAVFAAAAVCFGVYAAFAFVRYHAQQQEFAEYRAHKAEYEERMQGLLDDNEKMLRDINEMATLESRLRRALIRDPEAGMKLAAPQQENAPADVKPGYTGQGGPAELGMIEMLDILTVQNKNIKQQIDDKELGMIEMLDILTVQNKNIKQQIDDKKTSMKELLLAMEKRSNSLNAFPDLWPGEGGTISSPYGGRMAPVGGGYDWHPGIDIAVDFGTPVYASAAGTVEQAGWNGGYGRYVKLDHGNGYETAYGHMSGIAVTEGEAVRKGDIIGFAGSSGYSTGPHIHFEVLVDGQFVDPMYMLSSK